MKRRRSEGAQPAVLPFGASTTQQFNGSTIFAREIPMSRKHSNTPPYVPRAGFRAVLDSIQNHKPGEVIRRDVLHKKGLSST